MVDWQSPPQELIASENELHLWRFQLDVPATRLSELNANLSLDEAERAQRFVFERDRNHFVASRGFLREILGGYAGIHPAQLKFTYNAHGKPALDSDEIAPKIVFNLSHSRGMGLLGITSGTRALGVDVEWARPLKDLMDMAKHFFSADEREVLAGMPAAERHIPFFHIWTRKEALIKGHGLGLSMPLDAFAVSHQPYDARLLWLSEAYGKREDWRLLDISFAPGFTAAAACTGEMPAIYHWLVS